MPGRSLIALALVTLTVVVACWSAIGQRYATAEFKKQAGGAVFPGLISRIATVSEIEVARDGSSFTLSRNDINWANHGLGGFPANSTRIENVITAVASIKYLEPKTKRPALYHKLEVEDVGTNSRSTRVTLKINSGEVLANLIVGKAKQSNSARPALYIRLVGEERAWLVEGRLDLRYDAVDWSDRLVIDIDADAVMTMTVEHADGEVVALGRNDDAGMTLANLPMDTVIQHQYQIDFMAGLLEAVSFNDARPVGASDGDTPTAFKVAITTRDHIDLTMRASEPGTDGSTWVQFSARAGNEQGATAGARQTANRINSNFGGWSLRLPRKFTDRLKIRLSDIIETPITNNEITQ